MGHAIALSFHQRFSHALSHGASLLLSHCSPSPGRAFVRAPPAPFSFPPLATSGLASSGTGINSAGASDEALTTPIPLHFFATPPGGLLRLQAADARLAPSHARTLASLCSPGHHHLSSAGYFSFNFFTSLLPALLAPFTFLLWYPQPTRRLALALSPTLQFRPQRLPISPPAPSIMFSSALKDRDRGGLTHDEDLDLGTSLDMIIHNTDFICSSRTSQQYTIIFNSIYSLFNLSRHLERWTSSRRMCVDTSIGELSKSFSELLP